MAGQCTIARDQNGEIQDVFAPNQKSSKLFTSAVESINDSSKEGKEKALKIWARAYTPTFKERFGDWELISQAKGVANEIKGIYKDIFNTDPQQTMFEASVQSHSSKVEHENAVKTFGKDFVALSRKLFPNAKVGQTYKPIVSRPLDVNGEPLIEYVLNSKEKEQQTKSLDFDPDVVEKMMEIEPYKILTVKDLDSLKDKFEEDFRKNVSPEYFISEGERIMTHTYRLIKHLSTPNTEIRFVAQNDSYKGVS